MTTSKPGTATRTLYFDKFNREIRSQTAGFDNRAIRIDTEYDNLGLVKSASRPYYVGDPIYLTTYHYDLLNCAITETNPQNKTSHFDYYR